MNEAGMDCACRFQGLFVSVSPALRPTPNTRLRLPRPLNQVVLTQPPFDAESAARWAEDAARRGITQRAKLMVGHPMIRWLEAKAKA
jgi:hypothetical protein